MSLGANIRLLRLAKGWDQKTLAASSGVKIGTISAIEVRNSRKSEHVSALAAALSVSAEVLADSEAVQALVDGGHPLKAAPELHCSEPTVEQALRVLDAALSSLTLSDREVATGLLMGLKTPRRHEAIAAMLNGAIAALNRKRTVPGAK